MSSGIETPAAGRRQAAVVLVVLAALALAAVEAGAQESGWTAPRTADGRPDLQGIWSNNTATPLERPTAFAGKESLTDEELAELQARAAELRDSEQAGNLLGDLLIQQVLEDPDFKEFDAGTGNYNSFWLAERQLDNRTSLIVDPPDGRLPAFTAAALERFGSRPPAGDKPEGPESLPLTERCITYGVPNLLAGYNSYFQIMQTGDHVVFLQELIHDARIIPIDKPGARRVDPPVARRLARPLGGRHAGDRDGQLFEPVHAARREPEHARYGAAAARRPGHAGVRHHLRRPRHLGASLDADDPAERVGRGAVRIRLPRGELRHGGHSGRGARAGSGEPLTEYGGGVDPHLHAGRACATIRPSASPAGTHAH